MNIISVVRKYIIKDLTGLVENYYNQTIVRDMGKFGCWKENLCYDVDRNFAGACRGGHLEIVKLLIEKGANNWNWGIYQACWDGHFKIVKYLAKLRMKNRIYYELSCGYQSIRRRTNDWNLNITPYSLHENIRKYLAKLKKSEKHFSTYL